VAVAEVRGLYGGLLFGIDEEPDATCRALHDGWQTLGEKPANQIIDLAA
jgi:hypothetical protein